MDFYETLILGAQAYQSYQLNQISDSIDELNARQSEQIANQERQQYIVNRVDGYHQDLIEWRSKLESAPGPVAYCAFDFLRWCELEGVGRPSMPTLEYKELFSKTAKLAQQSFRDCAVYYSKDDLFRIKRLVYLQAGYLEALQKLICWRKIRSGMLGKWYFYNPGAIEQIILFLPILLFCMGTLFIGFFALYGMIVWRDKLRKRALDALAPLATEAGGFLKPTATLTEVTQVLNQVTQSAATHRINVNLPTAQLEALYAELKPECEESCLRYLQDPPIQLAIDPAPPGSQN